MPNRPRKRDAASIHVRAGDNSTISYMMPMIATSRGYEPTLNVHLDTITVTSSLNDIRLITADSCVVGISGDSTRPYPLYIILTIYSSRSRFIANCLLL